MDNTKKARRVLTRLGRPGGYVRTLTAGEVDTLAAMYDERVAPVEGLPEAFADFWEGHTARLEDSKGTIDEGSFADEGLTTEDTEVAEEKGEAEAPAEELTTEGTEEVTPQS